MKKINCLVYGHYGHDNIGDELFKVAFKKIFPEYNFTFTDTLKKELMEDKDALFFGGGSFLNQHVEGFTSWDINFYQQYPIFYIGVGLETEIHQDHWMFLNMAKLIASRSINSKKIDSIFVPDLVYSLQERVDSTHINNSVLILPNVSVLPSYNSPSWITSAWENFKNQFAQFCDWLIDNDYNPIFYPMCQNRQQHDNFAAYQIISMMKNKDYYLIDNFETEAVDESDILWLFNRFDAVITQRYHGIILSNMVNIPVLPIYHHDKLNVAGAISYYETSKHKLIDSFNTLNKPNIVVSSFHFDELKKKVDDILNNHEQICWYKKQ